MTKGGAPLEHNATIYLSPADGADGVGSSGQVIDSKFEIPAESGPTPGKQYKVKVVTVPGIPPDGTPPNQIKRPQTYEMTIEIPARSEDNSELTINFP